jgi:hypothetical protein
VALLAAVWLAVACEAAPDDPRTTLMGQCPPDRPTWETFGEVFMTSYCTRCHTSSLSGSARRGAPSDHNFDTAASVRTETRHVHADAGAGPDYVNTKMPPDGLAPSADERRRLTEWLLCGTP